MTVKQLRAFLNDKPDDAVVIMRKDAEGYLNSPLVRIVDAVYVQNEPGLGDAYEAGEIAQEEVEQGRYLRAVLLISIK